MKKISKLSSIVFLTFLFSFSVHSAEWVFVTDQEGRKHYIDRDSIMDESGFKWSYYKSVYPSPQNGSDYLTKKTYSYNSAVSYMAFNCETRTLIPVSTRYLDDKDKVVHTIRYSHEKAIIDGDRTWELDDNPDSFRASIINYICK